MADNIATLVRMANQIADFFIPYPQAQAVAGVREHVTSFWTPQMRKDLAAYVAAGGAGLRPVVIAAFAP
jgi:formate dehydrogenase subunit delta